MDRITQLVNAIRDSHSWWEVRAEVKELAALSGRNFEFETAHGKNLRQIFESSLNEYPGESNRLLCPDIPDYIDRCDYVRNVLMSMPKKERFRAPDGTLSAVRTVKLSAKALADYPDIGRVRVTGIMVVDRHLRIGMEIPGDTSRKYLDVPGGIPYVPVAVDIRVKNTDLPDKSAVMDDSGRIHADSRELPKQYLFYLTDDGEQIPVPRTFVAIPQEFFGSDDIFCIRAFWIECGQLLLLYEESDGTYRTIRLGRTPTISERLRDIRHQAGISQLEIARACRIPLTTYSGWERRVRECADYIPYLIRQLLIKEQYIHD